MTAAVATPAGKYDAAAVPSATINTDNGDSGNNGSNGKSNKKKKRSKKNNNKKKSNNNSSSNAQNNNNDVNDTNNNGAQKDGEASTASTAPTALAANSTISSSSDASPSPPATTTTMTSTAVSANERRKKQSKTTNNFLLNNNSSNSSSNNKRNDLEKSNKPKSSQKQSPLQNALYSALMLIAICRTLPLLICTTTINACGKEYVHAVVDDIILISSGSSSSGDGVVSSIRGVGGEEENEDISQESFACHAASLAIGHFVHWVPYGKDLIGYDHHPGGHYSPSFHRDDAIVNPEKQNNEENGKKRGIFQRVISKHKSKHHDHETMQQQQQQQLKHAATEEIDRKHPLRHILEGASIFSHHRQMKKKKQQQQQRELEKQQQGDGSKVSSVAEGEGGKEGGDVVVKKQLKDIKVDWKKWKYAMSDDFQLSNEQTTIVKELAKRVLIMAKQVGSKTSVEIVKEASRKDSGSNNDGGNGNARESNTQGGNNNSESLVDTKPFLERVDQVPWGGVYNKESNRWYPRRDNGKKPDRVSGQVEGGRLLASYLKIMKWQKDLHVKFPFKLCANGCDSEVAILHTLEWREKYKPFCMSPTSIQRNNVGFVYHRGHSRPGPLQRKEAEKSNNRNYLDQFGHSMVWYRPGLTDASDPEMYIRTMVHTLEQAVSDSLLRNNGEIGRFNVVMDCKDFGRKSSPSLSYIKKGFLFLQDHYPDRLGVLLVVNLSGIAQMMMKLVLPFVDEEVRAKIHIIPDGAEERREILNQILEEDQIPDWLGGKDEYRFDDETYYRGEGKCVLTDEDVSEYRETMPYHA